VSDLDPVLSGLLQLGRLLTGAAGLAETVLAARRQNVELRRELTGLWAAARAVFENPDNPAARAELELRLRRLEAGELLDPPP
jgi:hypothetical protein